MQIRSLVKKAPRFPPYPRTPKVLTRQDIEVRTLAALGPAHLTLQLGLTTVFQLWPHCHCPTRCHLSFPSPLYSLLMSFSPTNHSPPQGGNQFLVLSFNAVPFGIARVWAIINKGDAHLNPKTLGFVYLRFCI